MVWRALRWLLFRLEPERAHALALAGLKALCATPRRRLTQGWATRRPAGRRAGAAEVALEVETLGLRFAHPLGLAAGFDKGEVVAPALLALGFSHVEVGTVTPRAQPGNAPPRLFRLPEHRALVNRMGFNNPGAETCATRLAALGAAPRGGVLGLNVGRNKDTPNDRAVDDYLACIDRLHPWADYLVVNISSPNTPGLRELQRRGALERLLGLCCDRARGLPVPRPLLVKLAPDLDSEALDEAVDVAIAAGVAGVVATNTTVARPDRTAYHPLAGEVGGLSGEPLAPLALQALRRIHRRARGRVPIIGVGGVMSAEDAYQRLLAGATLVQAYTGFVYGGPFFARALVRDLSRLLARDGFRDVREAVGVDAV